MQPWVVSNTIKHCQHRPSSQHETFTIGGRKIWGEVFTAVLEHQIGHMPTCFRYRIYHDDMFAGVQQSIDVCANFFRKSLAAGSLAHISVFTEGAKGNIAALLNTPFAIVESISFKCQCPATRQHDKLFLPLPEYIFKHRIIVEAAVTNFSCL